MLALPIALLVLQAQTFAVLPHPGPGVDAPARMDALCHNGAPASTTALLARESSLSLRAPRRGEVPTVWFELACVRMRLERAHVAPREGAAMPLGYLWSDGALAALLRGMDAKPDLPGAAALMSLIASTDVQPFQSADVARATVAATRSGVNDREALRGCSEFALRIDENPAVRECGQRGLGLGTDSTWHLIRLARESFRRADTTAGIQYFLAAAGAAHTPDARDEIAWHLQWFLWPDELLEWRTVPDTSSAAWIGTRLRVRDIRDGQRPGARLSEHFGRLEYVLEHFPQRVPAVSRDSLLSGTPQLLSNRAQPMSAAGMAIARVINDNQGKAGKIFPAARRFKRWQIDFDDRGVVWMRLGKPERVMQWGYGFARELWIYHIDGQIYLLNFSDEDYNGNVEATMLSNIPVDPFFCGIDKIICAASSGAGRPNPETLAYIGELNQRSITMGTLRDDNSPRDALLPLTAQVRRVWDPVSGDPLSLVTYSLSASDLASATTATGAAELGLRIRQWNHDASDVRDSAFTRVVPLRDLLDGDPHVSGLVVMPPPADVREWSIVATLPGGMRGRVLQPEGHPLPDTPIAISDLVLGAPSNGLFWDAGGRRVAVNAVGAFRHTAPVTVYFQVGSQRAIDSVNVSIGLVRQLPARPDAAVLEVSFAGALVAGMTEFERSLDVTSLAPGRYQVRVAVRDANGREILHQVITMVLQ